ncbi:MAG: hypothetical protein K0R67_1768 [Paenibacillus sp.]|jgi:hypothetical protein|nr:hypothetical protein [Paenibacillus sp.]
MFKSLRRVCSNILTTLAGVAVLYFGFPITAYASASKGIPDAAKNLMIGVFVGGVLVMAGFIYIVYRTSKKNRRS